MTRILREIIGGKEPTFSARIQQLEATTGKRTIDIELTAEMLVQLSVATKKLQLDPLDTTPEELYAAVIQKAKEHDDLLRTSFHQDILSLIRVINHHSGTVAVPVIKQSTLRTIIGEVAPKKVMACLGYRSVASLLKRADINQVLIGAFMHESVTWHRAFSKKLKQCSMSDITLEKPKVILVDRLLLKNVKQPHVIPYVQFAGIVGIAGSNVQNPFGWLEIAARSADGLFHIHQRGVYLKLHRFQPYIVKRIVELTYVAPLSVVKLASVRIPWTSIYGYISKNIDDMIFADESAVEKGDFLWAGPVELLKSIHQQMDFWRITRIVAKPTETKPVSLNISDIAFNALHGVSYQQRSHSHVSRQTLDELLSRYFTHFSSKDDALKSIGLYV